MKRRTMTAVLAAALLLAGCSSGGPSEAEDTACQLYAAANNRMESAHNAYFELGETSDLAADASATVQELPDAISQAADRATGELAVLMSDSARHAQVMAEEVEQGVAFHLQRPDVYEACDDLGVDLEIVEVSD